MADLTLRPDADLARIGLAIRFLGIADLFLCPCVYTLLTTVLNSPRLFLLVTPW